MEKVISLTPEMMKGRAVFLDLFPELVAREGNGDLDLRWQEWVDGFSNSEGRQHSAHARSKCFST